MKVLQHCTAAENASASQNVNVYVLRRKPFATIETHLRNAAAAETMARHGFRHGLSDRRYQRVDKSSYKSCRARLPLH